MIDTYVNSSDYKKQSSMLARNSLSLFINQQL